jgi:hypothetical protein
MNEKYLIVKECRIEQLAENCLELGLTEETPVAVTDKRGLIELLPVLNDYGNNNKSRRHLSKNFIMPVTLGYARKLKRELERGKEYTD